MHAALLAYMLGHSMHVNHTCFADQSGRNVFGMSKRLGASAGLLNRFDNSIEQDLLHSDYLDFHLFKVMKGQGLQYLQKKQNGYQKCHWHNLDHARSKKVGVNYP